MTASWCLGRDDVPADSSRPADGNSSENTGEIPHASASHASSRAERFAALFADGAADGTTDEIQRLRAQRGALNAQKRAVTKTLRNECRKRTRMMARSSQLSNEDLVEVLAIRQARAVAKAKAEAAPEADH